ncbi:hypothetical protein O9992_05835 [Vibrio lentus]|nr:hypothetical protein [Vibrio lentus]
MKTFSLNTAFTPNSPSFATPNDDIGFATRVYQGVITALSSLTLTQGLGSRSEARPW